MNTRAGALATQYRPHYEIVAERLAHMVAQQQLTPGAKLPTEHQLCQQFGVSRTIIREALKVLATAGLVEVRKGVGTFVSGEGAASKNRFVFDYALLVDPQRMDALLTFRCMVETMAARLAATEITVAELRRLEAIVRQNQASATVSDVEQYLATDDAFHLGVARATHNPYLAESVERMLSLQRWAMPLIRDKLPPYWQRSAEQHAAICAALSQSQPDEAAAAMRDHIMMIHDTYLSEVRQRLLSTTESNT